MKKIKYRNCGFCNPEMKAICTKIYICGPYCASFTFDQDNTNSAKAIKCASDIVCLFTLIGEAVKDDSQYNEIHGKLLEVVEQLKTIRQFKESK